jgi:hypothetical protein
MTRSLNIVFFVIALLIVFYAGCNYGKQDIKTVVKHDTVFVDKPPVVIKSKPINTVKWKYKTIYKDRIVKGKTIIDSIHHFEIRYRDTTFAFSDSLRKDSQYVAIQGKGNCFGIIGLTATWGGKERVITKTITNTIKEKGSRFGLFAGLEVAFSDSISDITPNVMGVINNKTAISYGFGVNTRQHKIGARRTIFQW